MNPGARTRPLASSTCSPGIGATSPTATMRSPAMRRLPRRAGAPVPSIRRALTMRSVGAGLSARFAAPRKVGARSARRRETARRGRLTVSSILPCLAAGIAPSRSRNERKSLILKSIPNGSQFEHLRPADRLPPQDERATPVPLGSVAEGWAATSGTSRELLRSGQGWLSGNLFRNQQVVGSDFSPGVSPVCFGVHDRHGWRAATARAPPRTLRTSERKRGVCGAEAPGWTYGPSTQRHLDLEGH